jgi:hypothetical protein
MISFVDPLYTEDALCAHSVLYIIPQSLYHYLTDHPRVIPAVEKQIHYLYVLVCCGGVFLC